MATTVTYDREADTLFIRFGAKPRRAGAVTTVVVRPGVHLDVGATGTVLALEVLNASRQLPAGAIEGHATAVEWLSLAEAAAWSQRSASTLRVQINAGRLAADKRGRDWFIARHVLADYLERVGERAAARPAPRAR